MQKWTSLFRTGDHVIHIYRDETELVRSLVDIITAANEDEKIFYLSDKNLEKNVSCTNRKTDETIGIALKNGKLSIIPSYKTYCPTGEFSMKTILKFWWELSNKIDEKGYESGIVAGDISWLAHRPSLFQSFLQYEQAIDLYGLPKNIKIICQYDSKLFNSQQIESVMRAHQLVLRGQSLERRNWIVSRKMKDSIFSIF